MTDKKKPDVISDMLTVGSILTEGQPMGRWNEGLMFKGISPQPWLKSAANWLPNTEDLNPEEIRITFMGSAPMIRPGQMNTSIFIELGNGDSFVFDFGEGCIANYIAARHSLNEINDIFLTHLHVDHFGALPYLYMFGAWAGRWDEPLRIYGPSGRTKKDGVKYMVEGMKMMTHWHRDAFDVFPIGEGWETDVTEFDFRDDGGTVYDKNGVKVIHWRQSHAKDGASAYRLDWNGMSVVFTGDGRPNSLTENYAEDCDILILECQPEVVAISSQVQGVPPFLGRYTIDTHHQSGYAVGHIFDKVKPRLGMTTHTPDDEYLNAEQVAEIREHWKGPFNFGFDRTVVNMTKDQIWVREGVIPERPNVKPPQFDLSKGTVDVPLPRHQRKDIQQKAIRDAEIPPESYYPEGFHPKLLQDWPAAKPISAPLGILPEALKQNFGESHRKKAALRAYHEEKAKAGKKEE